jgi:hypothetical protein
MEKINVIVPGEGNMLLVAQYLVKHGDSIRVLDGRFVRYSKKIKRGQSDAIGRVIAKIKVWVPAVIGDMGECIAVAHDWATAELIERAVVRAADFQ